MYYDTQSSSSNDTTSKISNLNMSDTQLGTGNMQYNIGAQKETFNYTFEELQQYFLAHDNIFNQEHEDKETGIYNYSQKAKDVYTKMLSIEDKISKKVAQYDKELQKVNKNLSKAMQKFMHNSKNKADNNLHEKMMNDENVKQYLKQRQELIGKKNNVRQREQLKFMRWEKGHMHGENVIERNNNYLVTAAKSRAILNGCDDKTVEQIDKGAICDGQGAEINDNLTNIASSVANLLTEQYNKEQDKGKKNKIFQWISTVWKSIKEFLGIPVYDQSHDKFKQQLQTYIADAIKNNNISANDVKNNINKIQKTQEQVQREYKTNTQQYTNLAQSYQTNMSTQQGLDSSTMYNPNYSMDNKSMLSYNSDMSIINSNNNTMNSINGVNAGKLLNYKMSNLPNTVNNINKDAKIAQAMASQNNNINNNMQIQPNALNNNINAVISSPNPQLNNINQVVNNNNNIMSSTNPQNNINSVNNNSNNMPQQIPQLKNINSLANNNNNNNMSLTNSQSNNANQMTKNNSILLSGVQPDATIFNPNIMANNNANQPSVNSGVSTIK